MRESISCHQSSSNSSNKFAKAIALLLVAGATINDNHAAQVSAVGISNHNHILAQKKNSKNDHHDDNISL